MLDWCCAGHACLWLVVESVHRVYTQTAPPEHLINENVEDVHFFDNQERPNIPIY